MLKKLPYLFLLFPTIIVYAQWVQTNGPYGGQINSLVSLSNNIYTSAGGSVLYSANNGTTWNSTGLTNAGVRAIVGEGNKLVAIGSQVFVSVNEGVNWSVIGSSVPWTNLITITASSRILFVTALGISLPSHHLVYNVYRSTDDGASWTSVDSDLSNTGVNAIDYIGDSSIYAGTTSGVYTSTDSGASWKLAGLQGISISAIRVISRDTGSTNIFAATNRGVLRSTNDGMSWSFVNSGLSDTVVTALAVYPKTQGSTEILAGTQGGKIFLSTNNGDNWSDVSNGLIAGPWEWGDWEADVRSLTVAGSNFFAGTNAGLFLSTNNGSTWEHADNGINNSIAINALEVFSSEYGNSILAGGFPSGVFISSDNGSHWDAANNGINSIDINALAISDKNIFAGGPTGVFVSTNSGVSWDTTGLSNTGEVVSLLSAADAKGDTLILAGTWDGLFISPNNGKTWNSTELKQGITALAAYPNGQTGMNIFAGTAGSGIFLSTDNGVTWNSLHNGIPVVENINAICFCGEDLFAATDYILYRSTDNGTSWTPTGLNTAAISSNTFIYSLVVDTNGTNGLNIFAGTNDHGVLVSKDTGDTWDTANLGLTDLCIYSLCVSGSYLFAGTNISGIWKRPISELTGIYETSPKKLPQMFSLYQNYPNPFNPATIITYQIPKEGFVKVKVFDELGRKVKTLVNGLKSPGKYTVSFDGSNLSSGVYFYQLEAENYLAIKKMILLK